MELFTDTEQFEIAVECIEMRGFTHHEAIFLVKKRYNENGENSIKSLTKDIPLYSYRLHPPKSQYKY